MWQIKIGLLTKDKNFILNHFTMNYKTLEVTKYAALISGIPQIFSTLIFLDVNDPSLTWVAYTR